MIGAGSVGVHYTSGLCGSTLSWARQRRKFACWSVSRSATVCGTTQTVPARCASRRVQKTGSCRKRRRWIRSKSLTWVLPETCLIGMAGRGSGSTCPKRSLKRIRCADSSRQLVGTAERRLLRSPGCTVVVVKKQLGWDLGMKYVSTLERRAVLRARYPPVRGFHGAVVLMMLHHMDLMEKHPHLETRYRQGWQCASRPEPWTDLYRRSSRRRMVTAR